MKNKLAPSMMCCDFFHLREQMNAMEKNQIDLLHIDIMDGHFVPNLALGSDFVKQLRRETSIPLDLHFMTAFPERHLELFPIREGDYVSIHYETAVHLQRVLQTVKDKGAKPLLALNPATPVEMAVDVLDDIDGILVMTVNPGFAGQRMVPHAISKIQRTRAFLNANGREDAEIEVDGNVNVPNAVQMAEAGANIFVLGTSAIFCGDDMDRNIQNFKKAVFARS